MAQLEICASLLDEGKNQSVNQFETINFIPAMQSDNYVYCKIF